MCHKIAVFFFVELVSKKLQYKTGLKYVPESSGTTYLVYNLNLIFFIKLIKTLSFSYLHFTRITENTFYESRSRRIRIIIDTILNILLNYLLESMYVLIIHNLIF